MLKPSGDAVDTRIGRRHVLGGEMNAGVAHIHGRGSPIAWFSRICAGLRRKCHTNGEGLTQTVESTV